MSNLARVSDRLPRSARRAGRRLARTTLGRTVRSRLHRPEISVIVPFYNVEDYLAECLDSVLAQTFGDFEVVLVDDGSPDGSRTIAEQYAARDHRFHVVTRSNGGLGAARNTGVRAAHGHYLTFLDSDDELPRHALAVLHDSATATGSEIVAGVMERFTSVDSWFPTWVREIHTSRQRGIRILEFLPLLRNFYTCNKLFRRGFWLAQGLWFREGVAYEDQPIVTQLMARATAIDVIPDCTYRYRLRDDGSSISQQTASVKDLRDRVAAWRVSREAIHGEFPGPVYEGWLLTLFQTHFQWYLTSPGTVDDSYWNELVAAVRELAADAPDWVWRATQPPERLLVRLAQLGRRADVQELVRSGGTSPDRWPSHVREDGVVLELPLFGDPGLSDEVFLIDPARLQVAHSVENILWTGEGDQAQCVISGRAYVQKIDLAEHDQRVTLRLRDADTGDAIDVPSTAGPVPSFALPSDDLWCDYSPGRFEARFGAADLARRGPGEWSVWLAVEVAGFTVEQPVTNLVRSGSAGVVPALTLEDGARVVPAWRFGQQLCMVVEPGAA
ncbi:MAG: glycosyltransferase family 2 protein, partial [Marmoricola sp.]